MKNTRLLAVIAFGCCQAVAPGSQVPESPFDVLIRNGRVVDGTGNPSTLSDIGLRGGRIAAMGRLGDRAATRVIDADGLTVTPGFIDVHSHASEGLAGRLKEARQLLAQGITTVALNPDGGGPVDIKTQRATYERQGV